MVLEDTKGNRTGPNVEVRCKIEKGADANAMQTSVFRRLCPAMFDYPEKAFEKLRL